MVSGKAMVKEVRQHAWSSGWLLCLAVGYQFRKGCVSI